MFFKKIKVRPEQRAIVIMDGQLHAILPTGQHWVWHGSKKLEVHLNSMENLNVQWDGIQNAIDFEREKAEICWQIIDSEEGYVNIVWHKHLPACVVASGQSHAFWRPENDHLKILQIKNDEFWLPEEVQKSLYLQENIVPPLHRYTVNSQQKLLICQNGSLVKILEAGNYVLHQSSPNIQILLTDTETPYCTETHMPIWAAQNPELINQYFDIIETKDNQLTLWYTQNHLNGYILSSQRTYFWKNNYIPYKIEHIDLLNDFRISDALMTQINTTLNIPDDLIYTVEILPQHQGLLYIDQILQPILLPGIYYFWKINKHFHTQIVDMRPQTLEVSGQELLTEDKVTIRINAICNYQITDAPSWLAIHHQPQEFLYRELQFAIRAIIADKTMDALLANKRNIDQELSNIMKNKNLSGIQILDSGIKDIILPGEIRTILTRVVEAEKSAQANNIRRREETAATRSLLNTARVMEENPTALRLKELETLEKVTEKIDKISVYGGLDGVLNGLINIQNTK